MESRSLHNTLVARELIKKLFTESKRLESKPMDQRTMSDRRHLLDLYKLANQITKN